MVPRTTPETTPEPAAAQLAPRPSPLAPHTAPVHRPVPQSSPPAEAPRSDPPPTRKQPAKDESIAGVATRRGAKAVAPKADSAKTDSSKADSLKAPLPGRAPLESAEQALMPPPASKAKSKVQKTYGRRQPAARQVQALDVFAGL